MNNALVNVNGEILKAGQAKVSVFDRGFLYGDSLYEVIRSYNGKFLYLDQHLQRLEKSAELCQMTLGQTIQTYHDDIYRTFKAFRALPGQAKTEAYCRLIVTRGVGKIGFGLNCIETPTQYSIIMQPIDVPPDEQYRKGLRMKISDRLRNNPKALDPAMKSGNYLNSLLAYLDASAADFDDALLCNADGHLTEGTTFNIFYVRRGIIATPPLDVGILDGITRQHVVGLARKLKIEVREVRFPKEYLYEAEEVFLSSSIKEVMAITQVDNRKIGNGKPGPITLKLRKAYDAEIPS